MDGEPFTLIEDGEITVHSSGPMPEFLRNKNLPDLPWDTPHLDTDIIVLTWGRDDLRITPEELATMSGEAKRELLRKIYDKIGLRPLTMETPP